MTRKSFFTSIFGIVGALVLPSIKPTTPKPDPHKFSYLKGDKNHDVFEIVHYPGGVSTLINRTAPLRAQIDALHALTVVRG